MQARLTIGEDEHLVFWSSPMILEADAGSDPAGPNGLEEAFKKMLLEMARVFVAAWHGVRTPMHVPE